MARATGTFTCKPTAQPAARVQVPDAAGWQQQAAQALKSAESLYVHKLLVSGTMSDMPFSVATAIQVEGLHHILMLPLTAQQATGLLAVGNAANNSQRRSGRGAKTSSTLAAACISAAHVTTKLLWRQHISVLVDRIMQAWGLKVGGHVQAHLREMMVCTAGGQTTLHKKGEATAGVFGTLMVQLPVIGGHEGGQVLVRHQGCTQCWDSADCRPTGFQYAAFYSDVECQLQPVTAGTQVVMVYGLTCNGATSIPSATAGFMLVKQLQAAVAKWEQELATGRSDTPQMLCVSLTHQSRLDRLLLPQLQDRDASVLTCLNHADCGLQVCVTAINRVQTFVDRIVEQHQENQHQSWWSDDNEEDFYTDEQPSYGDVSGWAARCGKLLCTQLSGEVPWVTADGKSGLHSSLQYLGRNAFYNYKVAVDGSYLDEQEISLSSKQYVAIFWPASHGPALIAKHGLPMAQQVLHSYFKLQGAAAGHWKACVGTSQDENRTNAWSCSMAGAQLPKPLVDAMAKLVDTHARSETNACCALAVTAAPSKELCRAITEPLLLQTLYAENAKQVVTALPRAAVCSLTALLCQIPAHHKHLCRLWPLIKAMPDAQLLLEQLLRDRYIRAAYSHSPQFLCGIAQARIEHLKDLLNDCKDEGWSMKGLQLPGHPDVQAFLDGPEQQAVLTDTFQWVNDAKQWAANYFDDCGRDGKLLVMVHVKRVREHVSMTLTKRRKRCHQCQEELKRVQQLLDVCSGDANQ